MGLKHINGDITRQRSLIGADDINGANQLDAVKDFYRFQILNKNVLVPLNELILAYKDVNITELIDLVDAANNDLIKTANNIL